MIVGFIFLIPKGDSAEFVWFVDIDDGNVSQPTFDVIRNLAIALKVSADELVFGEAERQASDDLKLRFCCPSPEFPKKKRRLSKALLEGMFLNHVSIGRMCEEVANLTQCHQDKVVEFVLAFVLKQQSAK